MTVRGFGARAKVNNELMFLYVEVATAYSYDPCDREGT